MATKKQEFSDLTINQARLFELVVLAVSELGGASKAVDTEDIAIRCLDMAPSVFSWRKYPQQANLEIVRVSLSDAKKIKNGQLLSGSGRDGWRLTKRGLDWVSGVGSTKRAAQRTTVTRRTAGSIDTVRLAQTIGRIESTSAWAAWRAGREVSSDDARALFRIDSYTTERLLGIKITRLLSMFEIDTEHRRFLEAASKAMEAAGVSNA